MCDCIREMRALLKPHNTDLVTTLFGTQKCVLQTTKIESAKRARPMAVLATYCPMCGEPYEARPALKAETAPVVEGAVQ